MFAPIMNDHTEFERKYSKAVAELSDKSIGWSNPVHRFGLKLGFKLKPAYYNTFVFNFVTQSLVFILALVFPFWLWGKSLLLLALSALGGVVSGLFVAYGCHISAQKYNLSSWEEL